MSKDRAFKVMAKQDARVFAKGWHFKLSELLSMVPQLPILEREQNRLSDAVMLTQRKLGEVYKRAVEYVKCPTCKRKAEVYIIDGVRWAKCSMHWFKVEPEPKVKKGKQA